MTIVCYGMQTKQLVYVATPDNKITPFEKSYIKQSLVLNVLNVHQNRVYRSIRQKEQSIIIPQAQNRDDDITAEDVKIVRSLLAHQGKKFKPYIAALSPEDIIQHTHATYVLGAYQQFSFILDAYFHEDVKNTIGSWLINADVEEFVVKNMIKKRQQYKPQRIETVLEDCWLAYKNNSFFHLPSAMVDEKSNIVIDGNRHGCTFSFKGYERYDHCPIKAVSNKANYYVVQDDNKQGILLPFQNGVLDDVQAEFLENNGDITQVVFASNESCLVVASDADKNNLFYWILKSADHRCNDAWLERYEGNIGTIIINNEGTYIATSGIDQTEVVVWGTEHKTVQLLDDNYSYPVEAMMFSSDGQKLWICSGALVSLWQVDEHGQFNVVRTVQLTQEDAIICRMLLAEKIERMVVGTTEGKLYILSMDGQEIACLSKYSHSTINALVGNNKGIVASSTSDNIVVWDISTTACLAHLAGHSDITALSLKPDMRYLFSYSDMQLCAWHMYDESEVKLLQDFKENLPFLSCYALYEIYKKTKNNHNARLFYFLSLPIVKQVKEFIKKYLL